MRLVRTGRDTRRDTRRETRRDRGRHARLDARREAAVVRQAAGLCLHYPDDAFRARLPLLRAALAEVPGAASAALLAFLDDIDARDPQELAAHYVAIFDLRNRRSLYLSWWREGDTRRRGEALVRFKHVYRLHGREFVGDELPDFLPAVLEFTATGAEDAADAGVALLQEHRPGLELLRLALADASTPYTRVLEAICATLPGPSPKDRAEARALAHAGPPREEVGLDTYGSLPPAPGGSGFASPEVDGVAR
ncbi:nitrate reductase molybdenum cofactor assembly chaperone [Streptomyces sp. SID3343]|uniref:nitrate reductase molybdenum cofactor assembly chaperone n=1 Tax=Streptomyces sp. SID3343 TaxID=2690260 RepID=UPI00136DCBEB|nr:nitrate reductase molybdenum cofactor assembly chaperone [Streptomyces sp. SID3343]MYW01945.1 nitrate reductase molybdenum cofactor assembly chaperone [Streptomyces sp. SID3343]